MNTFCDLAADFSGLITVLCSCSSGIDGASVTENSAVTRIQRGPHSTKRRDNT